MEKIVSLQDDLEVYRLDKLKEEIDGVEDIIGGFEKASKELDMLCPNFVKTMEKTAGGKKIVDQAREKITHPKRLLFENLSSDFPSIRVNIRHLLCGFKHRNFSVAKRVSNKKMLTIENYIGIGEYILSYFDENDQQRIMKLGIDSMSIVQGPRVSSKVLDFLSTKDYVHATTSFTKDPVPIDCICVEIEKWWKRRD